MAAKKCTKCGEVKPLSEFYPHSQCKDGHRPDCKKCLYAAHRARFDPARHRVYTRRYREKNPLKDKEYYEKNKAILIPKMVEYNRRNKAAYLAKMRAWRKANPEKVQVWVRNRRAKLRGSAGTHSIDDVLELMEQQRGLCVACSCEIRQSFEVDHIVPVSRGGGNDRSNIQLLCPSCNREKRDKSMDEFLKTRSLKKEDEKNGRRSGDPRSLVEH